MNIYDRHSWDYYLWRTGKSKGKFAEYIGENEKILDSGGSGVMDEFLPDFVDVENYFNLDVSIKMLQHSQYTNVCVSADTIPFKDNA
ncbi:MAG: hypothetical protein HXS46_12945 [Theionarchaea archaeon]|nr:hypothetical protein [Theionarchaea archaeon]